MSEVCFFLIFHTGNRLMTPWIHIATLDGVPIPLFDTTGLSFVTKQ